MSSVGRGARIGAALTIMILVLTSCASAESSSDPQTKAAQLGRQISIRSSSSPALATLWLDSVESVACTEPGSLPPNKGHYLAATIVLQTTEAYQADSGWWMSAADFATVDEDGRTTGNGILTSCLPNHRYLPDDFYLSDSGYYGVVLLDSASEHGTLVYRPHNLPQDIAGWHWDY